MIIFFTKKKMNDVPVLPTDLFMYIMSLRASMFPTPPLLRQWPIPFTLRQELLDEVIAINTRINRAPRMEWGTLYTQFAIYRLRCQQYWLIRARERSVKGK